jgi:hypothetical protein
MRAAKGSYRAMKTSLSELPRPLRMKALAKKLRARRPNDPKAQKLAKNLEWAAKYIQKKTAN